jgi:hypothetical protein
MSPRRDTASPIGLLQRQREGDVKGEGLALGEGGGEGLLAQRSTQGGDELVLDLAKDSARCDAHALAQWRRRPAQSRRVLVSPARVGRDREAVEAQADALDRSDAIRCEGGAP